MKYIRTLFAASIVILAASCSKELGSDDSNVTEPAVLTAELSQPEDENGTKTFLDDLSVKWSSDDAIAVFANNATEFKKYTLSDGENTTLGEFTGDEVTAAYAYYPYKGVTSVDGSNNLSVVIPRVQTYSSSSFGQYDMPMLATASGSGLSFHNLMAVLKLRLTGTGIIDRIIVIANTAGTKLSGMATVATNGSIAFSTTDGEAYNWVELDCGAEGVTLSADNSIFYISVPAGSYSFTVRIVSKSSTVAPDKTVASAKTFTANKIKPMASYAVEFGSDFKYVDGAYVGDPESITINSVEYKWAPVNCGYDGEYENGKYGKVFQAGRKYGQRIACTITPDTGDRSASEGSDPFNEFKFYSSKYSTDQWNNPTPLVWDSSTEAKTQYDPCPQGWRVPSQNELATLMGYENSSSCHHTNRTYKNRLDESDGMLGLWMDGGKTENPTSGIFLPSVNMRSYKTGCSLATMYNSPLQYVARNFSCYNPLYQSNIVFDSDESDYRERMQRTLQSSAHAFSIRCIKE